MKRDAALLLVLALCVAQGVALAPLFSGGEPFGDDNSYHLNLCHQAERCLEEQPGQILDFWVPSWNGGFPIFQYYHHLAPIVVAAVHRALPFLELHDVFKGALVLLFALFPLSVYAGARGLGARRAVALGAAFCAPLMLSSFRYGLGIDAFLVQGLYAQLFGIVIFPLGLAAIARTVVTGRGWSLAVLGLSLCLVAHLVVGFHLGVSAALTLLLPGVRAGWGTLGRRIARLLGIYTLTFAVLAYWFVPMIVNLPYSAGEPFAPAEQFDSYGVGAVLAALADGSLLDHGRTLFLVAGVGAGPLTVLVIAGLVLVLATRRRRGARFPRLAAIAFLAWLLLFMGRQGPGAVLGLLPFADKVPFDRFVFGVHFFGAMLAGVAVGALLAAGRRKPALTGVLFLVAVAVLLGPHLARLRERARTIEDMEGGAAYRAGLLAAANDLRALPPGRVLVGPETGHGTHFTLGLLPLYGDQDVLLGFSSAAGLQALPYAAANRLDVSDPAALDAFAVRYRASRPGVPTPRFWSTRFRSGPFEVQERAGHGYVRIGAGEVLAEELGFGRLEARVGASAPTELVCAISFHPGWTAHVDGVETATRQIEPGFVALTLSPGEHRVTLAYRQPAWKPWLAWLSLGLLLGLVVWDVRARRRRVTTA